MKVVGCIRVSTDKQAEEGWGLILNASRCARE